MSEARCCAHVLVASATTSGNMYTLSDGVVPKRWSVPGKGKQL